MPGPNYDPSITIKKFFTGLFMTLIPIVFGYTLDFLQTEEFPPEVAIWIPLIVAVLHALMNAIKHWND